MVKIENLTPHDIIIKNENGTKVLRRLIAARVEVVHVVDVGTLNGVPITRNVYGDVQGLPPPVEDTIYVVSRMVCERCRDRNDLYIVNETIRDNMGRIVGCKSLTQNPYLDISCVGLDVCSQLADKSVCATLRNDSQVDYSAITFDYETGQYENI